MNLGETVSMPRGLCAYSQVISATESVLAGGAASAAEGEAKHVVSTINPADAQIANNCIILRLLELRCFFPFIVSPLLMHVFLFVIMTDSLLTDSDFFNPTARHNRFLATASLATRLRMNSGVTGVKTAPPNECFRWGGSIGLHRSFTNRRFNARPYLTTATKVATSWNKVLFALLRSCVWKIGCYGEEGKR